jgi:hypothetical protein
MKKLFQSIKQKPINLVLMVIALFLYFLNNTFLKVYTEGVVKKFLICHFNDFICPLFFIAYSNLLLISVNREMKKLKWIMIFGFCSGLIWEFVAPLIKPSSITDMLDLLFYILGTFLYWCIVKLFPDRRMKDGTTSKYN